MTIVVINDNVLMALSVIMLQSTWIVLPVFSPRFPQHTECRDGLVHELPSNAQHPAHEKRNHAFFYKITH